MRNIFKLILFITTLPPLEAEVLSTWKISLLDDLSKNILIDYDDSNWSEIQIPQSLSGIVQTQTKNVWLRRKISFDLSNQNSLVIFGINGKIEVYFNEVKIFSDPVIPQGSALIKLPISLYKKDSNLVAIKFTLSSPVESGIFGNIYLIETEHAIHEYYFKNLIILIQTVFLIGIAIFILSLFLRFRESKNYLYLSLFYFFTSFSSLLSNEVFIDQLKHSYLLNLFYGISMGLPVFLPVYFIRFFTLEYNKKYLDKNYDFIFSFATFVLIVSVSLFNIFYGNLLNLLWIFLFIIVFLYASYILFLELSQKFDNKNFIILMALIYLLYITIDSLLNWNYFKEERFINKTGVFFVLLLPSVMVLIEIIILQRNVEHKEVQFISFDILQTRIFSYIIIALKKPIMNLLETLKNEDIINLSQSKIKETIFHIEDFKKNLNDILELSRLEALEEPESYTEINVKDFLEAVLIRSNISYEIYVDPNLVIETSLELVNSLIIRLIDFPGFGSFQHIDLVITSDIKNRIFFKFFLFNKNIKLLNKIYNILQEKISDKEGLWIYWKTIKEIVRILGGEQKIKLFQKKYLFIEFALQGKSLEYLERSKHLENKKEFYSLIDMNDKDKDFRHGTKEKDFSFQKLIVSLQKFITKK